MEAHPFALFGALAAASVALLVLAGWLFGIDGLSTFLPDTTPMRINAAFGALLLSAAVIAQARSARGAFVLAAVAASLGAVTALEHLINADFRIDQLFGNDVAHYASHPGRMSIEAALLLVALGTAIGLWTVGFSGRLAGVLVTLAALGSLFALLRYLYGAADLYAERGPTRLSAPASLAFLFLALAAAALGPARGWFRVIASGQTAAARMARWLVPAAILIPSMASGLRLEGERLGLYSRESSAALGVAAIAVLFVAIILVLTRILDRVEVRQRAGDEELRRTRQEAERVLREANVELERRVAERTGALARTNEALADEILMRRSAEIDLTRERDFVTAVLATLGTLLVVLDRGGRIVRMNAAAERVSGWTWQEVASAPLWDTFLTEGERDEVMEVFTRIRAGDFPMAFENHWRTRSGELRRIAWSNNAISGADGEVEFIIASGIDVTDERRSQRVLETQRNDLAALAAALAESNAELEAFSYSVSHDLRAPLRAIEGFGQALEEDAAASLDAESRDHLRRIRAASARMGELIDALLALSRISRSEIRREEVSLSAVAAEVIDRLHGQDPSRTAEIDVAPGLVAAGDPRLLRVVIGNLLENAWKFTRNSEPARIELASVWRDGEKTFFVRDNGAGFDMAYAGKLFAPFQRLHSMSEYPGTGIGLATVRRIIQRHGGRVWAEGEPGRGATFFFTLPREDA
ncbi:MAG TPA: ATP-binding protein [Thermoanaerobaculia bacterium]|nr:ATP-binding protein [Thermoanaerobaculia bacterium]